MTITEHALTDEVFWDHFWEDIKLPDIIDVRVQWYLALTNELRRHLPQDSALKLFEIGCAPGRWLIWFNQALGYHVAGCDISPHGVQLTQENLRLNNVSGEIYQADVFADTLPEQAFDIVFSVGVIEHFEQPEAIINRHLRLLKPGGYLVLEVPNMAGWLNLWLMRLAGMHDFLAVHNLTVMNQAYFQTIARNFNLQTTFLGYIGGFDPGLILYNYVQVLQGKRIRQELWRRRAFIIPFIWLLERLFNRSPSFFTRFNAPFCSHMLLGIFRTPQKP